MSNRRNDRISLSKVLSPFTLRLSKIESRELEDLVLDCRETKEHIVSEYIGHYIQLEPKERNRAKKQFRRRVLAILPASIKEKIPIHIQQKYEYNPASSEGFVPLHTVIDPFRLSGLDHKIVYDTIWNTPRLKQRVVLIAKDRLRPYIRIRGLYFFRRDVLEELPEDYKKLLPEKITRKYTQQPSISTIKLQ